MFLDFNWENAGDMFNGLVSDFFFDFINVCSFSLVVSTALDFVNFKETSLSDEECTTDDESKRFHVTVSLSLFSLLEIKGKKTI